MAYRLYSNEHIKALLKDVQKIFPLYILSIDLSDPKDITLFVKDNMAYSKRFKTKRECICYLLGLIDCAYLMEK